MRNYEVGQLLAERYEVVSPIGKGGMASVYKAFDIITEKMVAVKVVAPEIIVKQTGQERFEIEKEAFAKLSSNANVVQLFDFFQSGDEWFIILECVEGGTLKDKLQRQGAMTLKEIKYYFGNLCDALQAAHNLGIVHRDIKPDNVLLTQSGEVKLGDFGISVMEGFTSEAAKAIGTPKYMPPEVIEAKKATPRSDIYSLGIMLYEFSTGVAPFLAKDAKKIATKHIKEKPTAPRLINPTIPQSLENIILRMIEKDPDNRYFSMKEVQLDLMSVKITDAPKPYVYHLKNTIHTDRGSLHIKLGTAVEKLPFILKNKFIITSLLLALLLLIALVVAMVI